MAYRRRQGISRSATFKEEFEHSSPASASPICHFEHSSPASASPICHFEHSSPASASPICHFKTKTLISSRCFSISTSTSKGSNGFDDLRNDSKGFWGVLARKAKTILDDDDNLSHHAGVGLDTSTTSQKQEASEGHRRMENPIIRRGLDKLNSSLNHIGDTFEKAFEEGRTIVENKTQDIIQETRNIKMRRKEAENQVAPAFTTNLEQHQQQQQPTLDLQNQTNNQTQHKVAVATAAKAKLLLRELKTVKADLSFSKERCDQLEEENKILRESQEKGDNPEDDDLIRVQLESLLAEKARLAKENSIYARENRFLREIVEYHQLSMQDVVYFDEGAEEVTAVPFSRLFCESPPLSPSGVSPCTTSTKEATLLHDIPSTIQQHEEAKDASNSEETNPNIPQPSPHNARGTQDATTLPPHSSLQT